MHARVSTIKHILFGSILVQVKRLPNFCSVKFTVKPSEAFLCGTHLLRIFKTDNSRRPLLDRAGDGAVVANQHARNLVAGNGAIGVQHASSRSPLAGFSDSHDFFKNVDQDALLSRRFTWPAEPWSSFAPTFYCIREDVVGSKKITGKLKFLADRVGQSGKWARPANTSPGDRVLARRAVRKRVSLASARAR